ncbi:hypothetical protein, partial [Pseudomonas cannabina]|uniref:hypothetical protein n=1 Tax=Pseudomonas cannabina TaxID=86840 RepID=UPI001C3F36BC
FRLTTPLSLSEFTPERLTKAFSAVPACNPYMRLLGGTEFKLSSVTLSVTNWITWSPTPYGMGCVSYRVIIIMKPWDNV